MGTTTIRHRPSVGTYGIPLVKLLPWCARCVLRPRHLLFEKRSLDARAREMGRGWAWAWAAPEPMADVAVAARGMGKAACWSWVRPVHRDDGGQIESAAFRRETRRPSFRSVWPGEWGSSPPSACERRNRLRDPKLRTVSYGVQFVPSRAGSCEADPGGQGRSWPNETDNAYPSRRHD